jgi:hypothetical protein
VACKGQPVSEPLGPEEMEDFKKRIENRYFSFSPIPRLLATIEHQQGEIERQRVVIEALRVMLTEEPIPWEQVKKELGL